MTHRGNEQPGGGAEGKRKSKDKAGAKPSRRGQPKSAMVNTMGMGHTAATQGAHSSMGKHQQTGDGGASDFDIGYEGPPAKV